MIGLGTEFLFGFEHCKDYPYQFMRNSEDRLLVRQAFLYPLEKVSSEIFVPFHNTYSHEPYHSSEMFVSSLGYTAFAFILSRLFYRRVQSRVGDQLFSVVEPVDVSQFSYKLHGCGFSHTIYGSEDIDFLFCDVFACLSEEGVDIFQKPLVEKELFDLLREDEFSVRPVCGDGMFSHIFYLLSGEGDATAFSFVRDGFLDILDGCSFYSSGGWKTFEKSEYGGREEVGSSLEFWKGNDDELFDIILETGEFMDDTFPFSHELFDVRRERKWRELLMEAGEEESDCSCVDAIGFGLSEVEFGEIGDEKRVEYETVVVERSKKG